MGTAGPPFRFFLFRRASLFVYVLPTASPAPPRPDTMRLSLTFVASVLAATGLVGANRKPIFRSPQPVAHAKLTDPCSTFTSRGDPRGPPHHREARRRSLYQVPLHLQVLGHRQSTPPPSPLQRAARLALTSAFSFYLAIGSRRATRATRRTSSSRSTT